MAGADVVVEAAGAAGAASSWPERTSPSWPERTAWSWPAADVVAPEVVVPGADVGGLRRPWSPPEVVSPDVVVSPTSWSPDVVVVASSVEVVTVSVVVVTAGNSNSVTPAGGGAAGSPGVTRRQRRIRVAGADLDAELIPLLDQIRLGGHVVDALHLGADGLQLLLRLIPVALVDHLLNLGHLGLGGQRHLVVAHHVSSHRTARCAARTASHPAPIRRPPRRTRRCRARRRPSRQPWSARAGCAAAAPGGVRPPRPRAAPRRPPAR